MESLDSQTWQRIGEAFDRALELEGEARAAALNALEPSVRRQVESLLEAHGEAGDFLEPPMRRPPPISRGPKTYAAGERLGDFVILKCIGEGALARVYLAQQLSLGRLVALKVSLNNGREGQVLAPLEHDHIVRVFSETILEDQNERHLCLQFVLGTNLERILEQRRALTGRELLDSIAALSTEENYWDPKAQRDRETLSGLSGVETVLWYGVRLAEALAYAHRRGVLHLDIKPANILLNSYGRPMLTDFNVSLQREPGGTSKVLGGTYQYMSPEQEAWFKTPEGPEIDERADIFSLGVVLQEMLRKVGFDSDPSTRRSLERILAKCTRPDPDQRYASAGDLAAALLGCLEFQRIQDELPTPGPIVRWAMLHPATGVTLGILIPQILGTVVNIGYNFIRIVSRLSLAQQGFFAQLCTWYNPVVYLLVGTLLFRPIHRAIRGYQRVLRDGGSEEESARLRRIFLRFPIPLIGWGVLAWLVSGVFFPWALDRFEGPLGPRLYAHFFTSHFLSCLVAMAYSYLATQFLMLRVFYPPLLSGEANPCKLAKAEIARDGVTLRFFHFSAAFIPMAAAGVLVWVGPESLNDETYSVYKVLVGVLLGCGMAGLVLAVQATSILNQTLRALTGLREGA